MHAHNRYEDALVGLDADSHRLRTEAGIALTNLAHGDDGSAAAGLMAAGAEEAIDDTESSCASLEGMTVAAAVARIDEAPHHGTLLVAACELFQLEMEKAVMHFSQAKAAESLIR